MPVEHIEPAELPDKEYPFIFTNHCYVGMYHSSKNMAGQSKALRTRWPEPLLEMCPEDAQKLGIKDNEMVKIVTRRGEQKCRVYIGDFVNPGVVAAPWHWGANVLTSDALDPQCEVPETKACACKIIPLGTTVGSFDEIKIVAEIQGGGK